MKEIPYVLPLRMKEMPATALADEGNSLTTALMWMNEIPSGALADEGNSLWCLGG